MATIVDVRLERVRLPFCVPLRLGRGQTTARDLLLVGVMSDEGPVGWGEVVALAPMRDLVALARSLREALLRRPVDQGAEGVEAGGPDGDRGPHGDLSRIAPSATAFGDPVGPAGEGAAGEGAAGRAVQAGFEAALLDLVGRLAGRPMAALLAESVRKAVPVNGFVDTTGLAPAAVADECRAITKTGIRTLKLKVEPGLDRTLRVLRAVRAAVGPDVALRLDLNGLLPEAEAAAWLRALEWADLEYVEQPIAPEEGHEALTRLRRTSPVPIAVDEAVTDAAAAEALVAAGACDVLVVKPSRVGGPRAARAIASAAAERGIDVVVSTLYETGIGLTAALQVAATLPGGRAHGLATLELLADDLIEEGLDVRDGTMALPSGPGLGVGIDTAAVARYRLGVPDEEGP
ncbi:MAG: hypothetical protein KatS3mg065_0721 [Chloroflexota bacterium]|nr:MAG: hypothetical protein KatS3mg065_0721 [Chloroflexota bacterium]